MLLKIILFQQDQFFQNLITSARNTVSAMKKPKYLHIPSASSILQVHVIKDLTTQLQGLFIIF